MSRTMLISTTVAAVAFALAGPGAAEGRHGAPATANPTPYSPALACLGVRGGWRDGAAPRIAVGRIGDLTGRIDFYNGAPAPQGAALFAVTALARAGVPVVERLDNSVAEMELAYARQHLLSDTPERAGESADNFRPILAGQVAGSRYYIVGGVTELNYNIASSQAELRGGGSGTADDRSPGGGLGGSRYVLNVAIDLRLVDTRSQAVVDTVSFQKQVVGVERSAGVTGLNLRGGDGVATGRFGLGAGAMEPLQFAVRTLVERGVFELVAGLQAGEAHDTCLPLAQGGPA